MSVTDLLRQVAERGVELWTEGSRLRFRAPPGALDAAHRDALRRERAAVVAELRARAAERVTVSPLSHNQRALWFIQQEVPQTAAYHVAAAARITSPVDIAALHDTAQALSDRHPMLRSTYVLTDDGQLTMRIHDVIDIAFDRVDVTGIGENALQDCVEAEHRRPFDLEHGPVFRCTLFTRAPDDHVLLLNMHHIAGDAWSLLLAIEEFLALYAEATGIAAKPLPHPGKEYTAFVEWQARFIESATGAALGETWQRTLAAPRGEVEIPPDRQRPERKSYRGAAHRFAIPPRLAARVRTFAREQGTTLYAVLLATYAAMLYRLSGTTDVIIGTPTFGRSQDDFTRTIGHFVNPVPMRIAVESTLSFRDLLGRVSQTVRRALDGQDYPLLLMVQHAHVARDVSRSPLFEAFFGLLAFDQLRDGVSDERQARPLSTVQDVAGLRIGPYLLRQHDTQFSLALQFSELNGALDGSLTYCTDLYDAETAARLCAHYITLLDGAIVNVDQAVEALPPQARRLGGDDAAVAPRGMSAAAQRLLDELEARDVRLQLDGDKLKVNAPVGALTDELKSRMSLLKSELIDATKAAAAPRGGLRRVARTPPLPISYAQQRLWFLDQMEPGNSHYNIAFPLRISGALDVAAMVGALNALPLRHEALRTRIRNVDGNPRAELMDDVGSVVRMVDISDRPADARVQEALRLADSHGRRAFDLANGPLIACLLVRLADDDHVLVISMHHIASDGWSIAVASQEICAVYDAAVARIPSPLPALALQYIDFAAWQREQMNSGLLAQQVGFWLRELAGAPVLLELPTDRPRPLMLTYRGARRRFRIEPEQLLSLKEFARANGVTLYMLLLAAWQILLHRYTGQDDVVVGSPLANRDDPALEPVIGCFVNNVAMRGRLGGNPPFREFLTQTSEAVLAAFDNREVPFDRIVEALRPARSTSHSPLFQAMFTLQSFPVDPAQPQGLKMELMSLRDDANEPSRFDITMEIDEHQDGLRTIYEYATDLFDEATIARMFGEYVELLRQALAAPDLRLRDIPMLTANDQRVLLDDVNATRFEHDRSVCIHEMVAAAAAASPDAIAVQASDTTLTYGQLERRSNQMAQLLRERGVTDGSLVGVCLDRIADLPVALLAVLKAGAAYVPVDPAHPAERLVYTLTDATVACVITEARFVPLVEASNAPLLLVDADDGAILAQSSHAPDSQVRPEDLAYVIYTSGSTGRPKGVEVEHRNVVNFLRSMGREPGFGRDDVLLAVTTPSFDIAGLEIFLPLVCGARTVIASRADVLDGEQLVRLLEETRATVMQATPATWRLMLDTGWQGSPALRVLCGGEAMPRDLARELLTRTGVIWNMYGPTETTIWSTTHHVTDASQDIPIGHAIGNTTVYVLDESGRPVPIGVAGELCIGGEGVARGYRRRPDLTQEKFVTVALEGRAAERVYRTGDVVRLRSDLTLEFVGRRDHQVKVRGYRIELGEIESILVEHASVRRAVVIVREDNPGDQRLVAYVIPADDGAMVDAETLRGLLRARLPEYMVPSTIVPLLELPLTPNGKIDRKGLPAPASLQPAPGAAVDIVMTDPQRRVAAIWREVLRVEHLGVDDNFFDRGGHSLLVVKVHAALRREFQRELTLVDLFQHTTIAAQADLLSSDAPDRDASMQRARARAARQVLA